MPRAKKLRTAKGSNYKEDDSALAPLYSVSYYSIWCIGRPMLRPGWSSSPAAGWLFLLGRSPPHYTSHKPQLR